MLKQILNQILGRNKIDKNGSLDEPPNECSEMVNKVVDLLENDWEEWKIKWNYYDKHFPRFEQLYHSNGLGLWIHDIRDKSPGLTLVYYSSEYAPVKILDFESKKEKKRLACVLRKIEAPLREQEIEKRKKEQEGLCKEIFQKISSKEEAL